MINIGNKKSKVLREYGSFIDKVREYRAKNIDNWLDESINWCINNGILSEFLIRRKDEVKKYMQLDMTFERRIEFIKRDAKEEGIQEGIKSLVQSCKELTGSKDIATKQVMKQYDKTEEEAGEYVEKYWE